MWSPNQYCRKASKVDILQANVLATSLGQACLADFGHSVIGDFQGLSSDSSHAGTLRWQAPELFNIGPDNVAKGPSSDMYAFACTCYEVSYTLNLARGNHTPCRFL